MLSRWQNLKTLLLSAWYIFNGPVVKRLKIGTKKLRWAVQVGDLVKYPATVVRGSGLGIIVALGKKRQICRIATQGPTHPSGYVVFTQAAVEVVSESR